MMNDESSCSTKSQPEATLRPPGSQPVGTPKPPRGYPEATLDGKVHPEGRKMARSQVSYVFTISSAYLFFTKMWVMTRPKAPKSVEPEGKAQHSL
jgi:hypothetical protein